MQRLVGGAWTGHAMRASVQEDDESMIDKEGYERVEKCGAQAAPIRQGTRDVSIVGSPVRRRVTGSQLLKRMGERGSKDRAPEERTSCSHQGNRRVTRRQGCREQ